jgi:lincosamide nucleotidyltransferase A/C/D/E
VSDFVMSEAQAVALVAGLTRAEIGFWVMGGWGVDALLGQASRPHHDLDVLVDVTDLPALQRWLRREGFVRGYAWDENDELELAGQAWDTAFVEQHPDGREVDVHAVHVGAGGAARLATGDPWWMPAGALTAIGHLAGLAFPCVTVEAQRAMHRGYKLPEKHLADLRRLDALS